MLFSENVTTVDGGGDEEEYDPANTNILLDVTIKSPIVVISNDDDEPNPTSSNNTPFFKKKISNFETGMFTSAQRQFPLIDSVYFY